MTQPAGVGRGGVLLNLGPLEQLRAGRLARRILQLLLGLALYGASMAMVVRGALGAIPWDVLHTGLIEHIPVTFGQMSILLALVVLLMWIPLRQKPGFGTVANVFLVGIAADVALALIPPTAHLPWQVTLTGLGIGLNGMATAMYMGTQLGPGPRDGFMTGLARVSGHSIRGVRTVIEVLVVGLGWALGGVVGLGTVLYALSIGPLTQFMLPWFTVALERPVAPPARDPARYPAPAPPTLPEK